MLRVLLGLLLVANLLLLAWAQGWLGAVLPPPSGGEREPGRIAAQVRPDLVVVLGARAASAAVGVARSAERLCLEAGPFSDADVAAAEAALAAAALPAGSWQREQVQQGPSWVLFAGRYAEASVRRAREDELRRAGLPFQVADAPAEIAGGLVVSRHASRDAAELALAATGDKPVKDLRVVAVPPPPLQHWLRVPAADGPMQSRLFELDRGFKPCVTRP
jgi:hypothetical protein